MIGCRFDSNRIWYNIVGMRRRGRTKVYKAVIVNTGKPGTNEPYARLEDGREFPMGWNMGKEYPLGTKGTAKYVSTTMAGLWLFTPDKS